MPSPEKDSAIGKVEQHAENVLSGNVAIQKYYIGGTKKKCKIAKRHNASKSEK